MVTTAYSHPTAATSSGDVDFTYTQLSVLASVLATGLEGKARTRDNRDRKLLERWATVAARMAEALTQKGACGHEGR